MEKRIKKTIKEAILEFKPDIIISHHLWLSTAIVGELISELGQSIKTIGVCHGTDIRQLKHSERYRRDVVCGCRKLDFVFSLNEEQKNIINKEYNISKEKIKVIGGGYSGEVFYPPLCKSQNSTIKIIYAGKLSYAKGLLSLLNVFKEIKDKYAIKLLLAGSGSDEEAASIKEISKSLGSKVEILGELSQPRLANVFRKGDIFVLPSFYEGLSLVTIEALASGLLVASSFIPGLKSYLGDKINSSGVIEYVELPKMKDIDNPLKEELPKFEKSLQKKIEKQINRINNGYIIDEGVRKEINKFSWEYVYKRIEEFFQ